MNTFNPMSYQSAMNSRMGLNNFQKSFNQNNSIIDRPDFANRGNVLHNNLGDSLQAEHVVEYQLYIDSVDRNTNNFPDPFSFTVTFGGVGGRTAIDTDGSITGTVGTQYQISGTAAPTLGRKFDNVKFVNLDHIILPSSNVIHVPTDVNGNGIIDPANPAEGIYYMMLASSTGESFKLEDVYKYLVLRFEELGTTKIFTTGKNFTDISFMLLPDQDLGGKSVLWKAKHDARVFPNSCLGKLSRLTPKLYDPFNNPITIMSNTYGTTTNTIYNLSADANQKVTPLPAGLSTLNAQMQVNYSFTIGVIENELNTLTKFEH